MPRAGIVNAGVNIVGEQRLSKRDKSINFRIHTLASSLSKGAMQYYGARFAVGLPEMRILSNLDSEGRLAAYQLVELTAMDKALVSRVLTTLSRRRYIISSAPKSDPRRRTWQLSRLGVDLVRELRPEWQRREAIIQAGLTNTDRKILAKLLDRMLAASEKLRTQEATEAQACAPRGVSAARVRPGIPVRGGGTTRNK
jgi:DNA-binding MarR family transcriptional regulator